MNTRKYSNKYILERVQQHCVDQMKSVHTLSNPCFNTIQNRCKEDSDFNSKFKNIAAAANERWEQIGITALLDRDPSFNVSLFKLYTSNKRPFLPFETLELEERITALEDKTNASEPLS